MKRSITQSVLLATLAVFVLAATGCGGSSGGAAADNTGTVVVRVNGNQ